MDVQVVEAAAAAAAAAALGAAGPHLAAMAAQHQQINQAGLNSSPGCSSSTRSVPTLESLCIGSYLSFLESECVALIALTQSESRLLQTASSSSSSSSPSQSLCGRLLQCLRAQLSARMSGVASSVLRQRMLALVLSDNFPSAMHCRRVAIQRKDDGSDAHSVSPFAYADMAEHESLFSTCIHTCCTGALIQEAMAGVLACSADIRELVFSTERMTPRRFGVIGGAHGIDFNAPVVITQMLSAIRDVGTAQIERIVFSENFVRDGDDDEDKDAASAAVLVSSLDLQKRQRSLVQEQIKRKQDRFCRPFAAPGIPYDGSDRKGLATTMLAMFRDVVPPDGRGYHKLTEIVLKNNVQCDLYSKATFQFELLSRIGSNCPRLRVLDLFGTDTWADCLVAFFFKDAFHSLHRYLYFMENEDDACSSYHPHDTTRYCQFCLDQLRPGRLSEPNECGCSTCGSCGGAVNPFFTTNPVIPLLDDIYEHVIKHYPKRSYCILRNCMRVSDLVAAPRSSVFELVREAASAKTESAARCTRQRRGGQPPPPPTSESAPGSKSRCFVAPLPSVRVTRQSARTARLTEPRRSTRSSTSRAQLAAETSSRKRKAGDVSLVPIPSRKSPRTTSSSTTGSSPTTAASAATSPVSYESWCSSNVCCDPAGVGGDEWVEPEAVRYREISGWPHLNACLDTLEVLNIGGTNVLGEFIPFVLLHAPRLRSLGQWINTMIYGLEVLRRLPGHESDVFPEMQEFSYSSDRNYFCQPYIGFVPETSEFKKVCREMVRFSGKVSRRLNHSARSQEQKRRQIEDDMRLLCDACPRIQKLNLVVHYKTPVLDEVDTRPWTSLVGLANLVELDLVAMRFVNVKSLLRSVGTRLRTLTLEMDEEQGGGSEIVHIGRHCENLASLRLLIGDKILRGEMSLHFGSLFFRRLERLVVEGSVHLHAFAFFWGHCKKLKYMRIGMVVSEMSSTNVLIHDVFTLLFQVNAMEDLEELHIKGLKIRSLTMGKFLLDSLPRLKRASGWILDLTSDEVKLFKAHLKGYRKRGLLLDYKEW